MASTCARRWRRPTTRTRTGPRPFASAIQGGTITLAGSELTNISDVTIEGGTGVTIDANQLSRVLLIAENTLADFHDVTLTSLTVTGGKTSADDARGGGIFGSMRA